VNKKVNVIVTVEGNYVVKQHPYLEFYLSNNIFRVQTGKDNYDYLWLKNAKKKTVKVESLAGFGNYLQINYPKDFSETEFKALKIT